MEGNKIRNGLMVSLSRQMRHATDEEREEMIRFMESDLHDFIVKYLMPDFRGIYLETQSSTYSELLKRLAITPEAKAIDDANGQRFQQALKLYKSFLSSKLFPSQKLRVQTSSDSQAKETSGQTKTTYVEGAVTQQTIDRRERSSEAREAAIKRDKYRCRVCGFDFETRYGPVGREYIEVHHIDPISSHDDEHEIEVDKLVCLCANCHAMAHRRRPMPFSIDELKQMIYDVREFTEDIH